MTRRANRYGRRHYFHVKPGDSFSATASPLTRQDLERAIARVKEERLEPSMDYTIVPHPDSPSWPMAVDFYRRHGIRLYFDRIRGVQLELLGDRGTDP